ncbi:MAG: hypothetical protein JO304_28260 [Solirubrobacterales bacterium]|nr:hypothetical protein [Solirubrobacterales bacterium]
MSVLALAAVGGDHLYVYAVEHYSAIPTIGTLFLVNAIGGFALAAALLVPLRALASRSRAAQLTVGLAGAGMALAGGALAALLVSESTPLFGFMEMGYRTSILIAMISEVTAIVALLILVAGTIHSAGGSRHSTRARLGGPRLIPVPGELSKHEPEDR